MVRLVSREESLDVYNQRGLGEDMHAVGIGASVASKWCPVFDTQYVVVQIERGILIDIFLIIRSIVSLIGWEELSQERRDNEEVQRDEVEEGGEAEI